MSHSILSLRAARPAWSPAPQASTDLSSPDFKMALR